MVVTQMVDVLLSVQIVKMTGHMSLTTRNAFRICAEHAASTDTASDLHSQGQ
jgi:hypothetical protein